MNRGYLKMWRKSLDTEVFQNPELWRLWSWCLMKTSHKDRFIPFTTGKGKISVNICSGQFAFGRNRSAEFLGDSPSTVWKRMKKLEAMGNISIQSNKQYSIVTICNWADYQQEEEGKEQASNRQVTSKEQPSDNQVTSKEHLSDTNKKVKKGENVKNIKTGTFENVFFSKEEMQKLEEKFNGTLQDKIDSLSEYVSSTGKKYKSHYATILSWDRRDKKQNKPKATPKTFSQIKDENMRKAMHDFCEED